LEIRTAQAVFSAGSDGDAPIELMIQLVETPQPERIQTVSGVGCAVINPHELRTMTSVATTASEFSSSTFHGGVNLRTPSLDSPRTK
jgi:hypothetical protein